MFAIQAQRAGTKISPARKGWVHSQAVERRRCGTTLFVCSLRARPTCPACPGPAVGGSAVSHTPSKGIMNPLPSQEQTINRSNLISFGQALFKTINVA